MLPRLLQLYLHARKDYRYPMALRIHRLQSGPHQRISLGRYRPSSQQWLDPW